MNLHMTKFLQILILFLSVSYLAKAQTDEGYVLTGNPVNTDFWQLTGSATVFGDEIVLVDALNNQTGGIYFDGLRKLYKCSEFKVSFTLRLSNNMPSVSDGISFWYHNAIPAGFSPGAGMGLPTNLDGFAAIIDLFDNDNNAATNNPYVSLRRYNGGNYVEGNNTGLLGDNSPAAINFANGANYNIIIHYINNIVSISVNGGAPIINVPSTGLATTFEGIFGFSATNGASNGSRVSIKNVKVESFPLPPKVITPTFCLDKTAPSFVYPNAGDVIWYNDTTSNDNMGTTFAPTIDVSNLDTFIYYVASRNANYCYGERMKITAIIHQSPKAEYSFLKREGCGADTIDFKNESEHADEYIWDFNDGFNSIAVDPQHVFLGEGVYNVLLVAQNEFCLDSIRKTIQLENPFLVDFTISKDSICQGESITFLNNSKITPKHGIDPIYHWDFGTGNAWDTSNLKNPPGKIYYDPGTYEIVLIGANAIPCIDTVYKTIVVDPKTNVAFTRSDTAICQGDEILFIGEVSEGGLNKFTWNFGDGSTILTDEKEVKRAFDQPGIYDITLTGDYRVCADSAFTKKITVAATPKIYLGQDTSLCSGGNSIKIEDGINRTNAGAKWLWNTGDTTASIIATNIGSYRATVTINGCSSSDEINIAKDCYVDVPNAFSPDGDGINDYFFPRKISDQHITKFTMTIYNRWGQIVFQTSNAEGTGWDGKLNGENQPFGVYVYQIEVIYANERAEKYDGNLTLLR